MIAPNSGDNSYWTKCMICPVEGIKERIALRDGRDLAWSEWGPDGGEAYCSVPARG